MSGKTNSLWTVIAASSAGTLIEWYDFYIFGSLATVISAQFFPKENEVAGLLSTLAIFATGFVVRPFGALVFGRIGDLVGRKYAFLVTLLMMGISTFSIGLVPGYSQIGVFAPLLVLLLRLTQGLALGGEYGGAATYVAEHAPDQRRGFYTSFIQTTATLGLLISIIVIIGGQLTLGKVAFDAWGWRIPFLLSSVLVVFSYFVRRKLHESPLFSEMKDQGRAATNPLKESFGNKENLKVVALALFGLTMGQGVVWYTGQFYAQVFLLSSQKVDPVTANLIIAIALILATPLFLFFGNLSDKIGRKKIMMMGCLLAVLAYVPVFSTIHRLTDVAHLQVSLGGIEQLGDSKISIAPKPDREKGIEKGDTVMESKFKVSFYGGVTAVKTIRVVRSQDPTKPEVSKEEWTDKKFPASTIATLIGLVFILVTFVTMVYGPIAAYLVELFPTRIRYSSMSLPYHIGNGVFGGLVPFIATALVAKTKIPTIGIYYPIAIAAITFVVGTLFLPDRRNVSLRD